MSLILHVVPLRKMFSVDVFLVTMMVSSNTGMLFPPPRTCLLELIRLFQVKTMCTCHAKLRYFDWDGQVHLTKGKTGGHQGDPLEMLVFNLTTSHLWGRVLTKFQESREIPYTDDGYINPS
jgi:hypothetical protein